ncbi:hypothetical protein ACFTAO_09315 [Paenibacillus rhizoplanae]
MVQAEREAAGCPVHTVEPCCAYGEFTFFHPLRIVGLNVQVT